MSAVSQTTLASSPNLRAYYSLNSVLTSSVNGYTLTNNGSAPFVTGKFGNAIDLGAGNTTDYLSIGSDLGITGGGAMAISLWIKMKAEISSGVNTFAVHQSDTSDVASSIFYDYNGGSRRVTFRRTRQNVAVEEASYTVALGATDYVHLVLNYDGSNVQGYINNTLRVSFASTGNGSGSNPSGFNLGRNISAANYASAIIDDAAVFNRALTTAEISELYTSSGGGAFFMLFD